VLEADVGEDDRDRVEDVCRVEPPAQPRLHGRRGRAGGGELRERGSGERFELRRADLLRRRPDARDRLLEVRLLPADPDPLAPAHDVRGDVRARKDALLEQERLDHARRRRLAVRADDVDRPHLPLRIAEPFEKGSHPPQAELLRPGAQALEPRCLRRRHKHLH
jgi:hypothetical protein